MDDGFMNYLCYDYHLRIITAAVTALLNGYVLISNAAVAEDFESCGKGGDDDPDGASVAAVRGTEEAVLELAI